MSSEKPVKIPTKEYSIGEKSPPVYRLKVRPKFNPIDINLQFIIEEGWSHADRLRFHTERGINIAKDHPLATLLTNFKPHLLIRRYDREEDSFLTVQISIDGEFEIFSNDGNFAQRYLRGLFLECPPSFHTAEELEIDEEWLDDTKICALFLGLLHGAMGWDPSHQIPQTIRISLEEAEKALDIANYRSCVVMCRRTVEALLKFSFPRLLGNSALDNNGRALTLSAMIERFKKQNPPPIPTHLLHVMDSVRVLGNIPGAHAKEIEGYQFSKHDAEFALASVNYFVEQYFSKIDKEISEYYTLTIDLNEKS
jgi:hypothetical protein